MVDMAVIYKILGSLNDTLEHLKSKKDISADVYRKDRDLQAIVERRLETAIQACIDIGNHIVAQENMGSPSDYREVFLILMQKKVINEQLAEKLMKMVGFRNILIHEYRDILIDKVYDVLQNRLSDFYEFSQSILDYLKQ